ncbi:hypothetical protein BS17DRAFT_126875 [Gyrodon lividus]|nr:hypothetical protein BS17DRAFT_126875 [Gyrodon lividus]
MSLELGHFRASANEKGLPFRNTTRTAASSSDAESSSDEEKSFPTRPLSQTLLGYALFNSFDHLAHLRPDHDLVWDDMKVLQADIRQHPAKWKNIRNTFRTDRRSWFGPLDWSSSQHDFMFYILVRSAPVSLLERFLDRNAPLPKDGTNPLLYAAHFDKAQHAQVLLSRGASVNSDGWVVNEPRRALPLDIAVEHGHCEVVSLFLAEGSRVPERLFEISLPPPNPGEMAPSLHERISLRVVRSLLRTDEFAEWATTCEDKQLLLHGVFQRATVMEEEAIIVDITRRLIQVGCDPSAPNDDGKTPLYAAVVGGHVSVVEYLFSTGIPLPPDILLAAARARKNQARMMRMLIDKGEDVHAPI